MPIRTRTILSTKAVGGLGVGALLLFAGSAANAQNALGDGNALDANPGQYGSSNYARPSLVDELRFRNSIATGNAPGGLSFRGDLGYRSAGEFTGDLGSDSLFAFRRDSLYSGLAGMGIRGTDALQYQFALTTGSAPPRNLIGNLSYTRDDAYATGSQFQSSQGTQNTGTLGIDREQSDLDPMGQALSTAASITGFDSGSMMGTLRSSATYNTTSTMQPSLLSVYTEGIDRRPVGLVASPLLGITPTPLKTDERPANPLVARADGVATEEGVPGAIPSARMTTSYDALVEQMRERVQAMRDESMVNGTSTTIQPDESNDAWLVRQMEEIRRNLYGEQPNQPNQAGDESDDPNTEQGTGTGGEEEPSGQGGGDGAPTTPIVSIPDNSGSPIAERIAETQEKLEKLNEDFELQDPTKVAIDRETLEVLRGIAADEVDQLLDPGAESRDLYAEHIVAGQRLIAAGRYFDAEERFTHALSLKPRDVIAQQGRLHAQIGAGMLLSASVNMQTLYSEHPELITTRYSGKLLPDAERIAALKQRLGERAGIIEMEIRTRPLEGDRVRVSAGMLYAYLGYQTGDEDIVRAGLAAVRELGADSDRRFANLLSQLWLTPEGSTNP
ncbi:MAG: hypothetical protein JJ916_10330 [Phycisphaerales bacterium]|nr:hypothetical protein [Phycisphaerales bacterium]